MKQLEFPFRRQLPHLKVHLLLSHLWSSTQFSLGVFSLVLESRAMSPVKSGRGIQEGQSTLVENKFDSGTGFSTLSSLFSKW